VFVGDAQGTIDMVTTVSGPRWSVRGAPEVRYPNCMGTWVVNFNLLAATAPFRTRFAIDESQASFAVLCSQPIL